MNNNSAKRNLFWLALAALSIGTLSGCEYCAPVMLALFIGNITYRAVHTISEALQIQTLN